MAYEFENKEDEELKGEASGEGQQLGAESAVITGDAPQPTEQGEGGSGQYVNLQSYISANAPRQFGQEVAGRVGETVKGAQESQQQASSQFRGAADTGSVAKDDEIVQRAVQTPEQVLQNQADRERFTRQRDATYQGPDQLAATDYYQPAQRATREASEQAEATSSEGGRNALLQQYYGGGAGRYNYTPGEQKLDQVLIGMDPQSKPLFEQQRMEAAKLNPAFQNLQSELQSYAASKRGETEAARAAARGTVGGAQQQTQKEIQDRYNKVMAERKAAMDAERARIANKQLSKKEAFESGLTGNDAYNVFTLDPSQYFSYSNDPSVHQVANAQERGRYDALAQLMGEQNTFLPYADQAGTYDPTKDVTFDKDRFFNDASAVKGQYDTAYGKEAFGQYNPTHDDLGWNSGLRGQSNQDLANAYGLDLGELQAAFGNYGISDPLFADGPGAGSLKTQAQKARDILKANERGEYVGSWNVARANQFLKLEEMLNKKYGIGNKFNIV